jgi:hypothetical protein
LVEIVQKSYGEVQNCFRCFITKRGSIRINVIGRVSEYHRKHSGVTNNVWDLLKAFLMKFYIGNFLFREIPKCSVFFEIKRGQSQIPERGRPAIGLIVPA